MVTVKAVEVTLNGALHDAKGKAELFTWDLGNDATWTAGSELEAGSVGATTLDADNNTLLLLDGDSYNMHEVDLATGKNLHTWNGIDGGNGNLPCSISLTATCTPVNRTAATWFGSMATMYPLCSIPMNWMPALTASSRHWPRRTPTSSPPLPTWAIMM